MFSSVLSTDDTNGVGLLCCFAFLWCWSSANGRARRAANGREQQTVQKSGQKLTSWLLFGATIFAMRGELPCAHTHSFSQNWLAFYPVCVCFNFCSQIAFLHTKSTNPLLAGFSYVRYIAALPPPPPTGSVSGPQRRAISTIIQHFLTQGWSSTAQLQLVFSVVLSPSIFPNATQRHPVRTGASNNAHCLFHIFLSSQIAST